MSNKVWAVMRETNGVPAMERIYSTKKLAEECKDALNTYVMEELFWVSEYPVLSHFTKAV